LCATRNDHLQCTWLTSFSSVHIYTYWISSASKRKHEIACTSWSSCLWKLCELVLNIEEQLCIVFMYMYTGNLYHLHDLAIWKWFKNVKAYIWNAFAYDVWTTDLGFCQVSKPFNTFSMAKCKVKNIAISSDPHSPFHCHACISYLSFTIFFSRICDWGNLGLTYDWGIFFILVTLDLFLVLIHRDLWNSQKWQILISLNRNLDFFFFLRFVTRNFFKVFVYGKGCQNRSKFTKFFSSIFIFIF
jgi:hypothetical protein